MSDQTSSSERVAAAVVNSLLSVLLAPGCAACNAVLTTPMDGCVCRSCWEAILPVDHLNFGEDSPLSKLVSVGSYDGSLREIVHALKYQGRRSIAVTLARLMRLSARDLLATADCVVPVPLHWRREYARGFNQAREIARHLGLPLVDALTRSRATTPQVTLSADERHANVAGAFAVRRATLLRAAPALEGRRAVLIDDVATTGATLEACARALKEAGASGVCGLTAARRA
jgi:ComF family protein